MRPLIDAITPNTWCAFPPAFRFLNEYDNFQGLHYVSHGKNSPKLIRLHTSFRDESTIFFHHQKTQN